MGEAAGDLFFRRDGHGEAGGVGVPQVALGHAQGGVGSAARRVARPRLRCRGSRPSNATPEANMDKSAGGPRVARAGSMGVSVSGRPLRQAFGDETFRDPRPSQGLPGYYQIAAVLVEGDDLAAFRNEVQGHAVNGEFKASELANAGNRQAVADLLDFVAEAPCFSIVVIRNEHPLSQEAARQQCVERVLIEASSQKVFGVTLDSREANIGPDPEVRNKKDLATRRRLVASGQVDRNLRLEHRHDRQEPVLWVPDAVGWAHRRHLLIGDSELWEKVESVTRVIAL